MSTQNPPPCECRASLSRETLTVPAHWRVKHCPLHSAAEQLFEACKAFVAAENHDGMHLAYTMARAAIAAAEGKS